MAKPTDEELLTQLLKEYRNGYLREDLLERAIVNIAKHYSRSHSDRLQEWLICGLLLTAGVIFLLWSPRYGFHTKRESEARLSPASSAKKVGALRVEAPNLIDDSPLGAYDFTLVGQSNETKNVPIPAPCSGTIKKTWFQGTTGTLQTGAGGGNIIDIECGNGRYGWRMAHLAEIQVKSGQQIEEGMSIGGQGCTGRCSGDHVHAQIHTLPNWQRVENRSITAPVIDRYLKKVKQGKWEP
jgi:Peptidase family M23